jgi:hypothetical protein
MTENTNNEKEKKELKQSVKKPVLPIKTNMKPKFPTNFKSSPNTMRRSQGKRGG